MNINEMIEFLKDCQKTHREWAEFFEGDPEAEHAMVGTGEWDDAETHRKIEKRYEETINYIKDLVFQLNKKDQDEQDKIKNRLETEKLKILVGHADYT